MTLVAGLKTPEQLLMLSDTRIFDRDATHVEVLPGRLKLVLLSKDLCVGVAGKIDPAIDTVRDLARRTAAVEDVLTNLQQASVRHEVEFLVGATSPARLIRVRRGAVLEVDEGWIGDTDAGNALAGAMQEHHHISDPHLRRVAAMLMAFRTVVDGCFESVGGLQVGVRLAPEGFIYDAKAHAIMPSQVIPAGDWHALGFGGADVGGCAYSILVPTDPGRSIVAVHFYQGRLGFVYAPLQHDKPVRVPNVSHQGLRDYVMTHFGCDINGARIG